MDAYESRTKFPVLKIVFRVPSPKIPCSNVQGISLKVLVFSALLRSTRSYKWVALKNFPVFFPVTREFGLMRPVRQRLRPPPRSPTQTEISRFSANSPELAAIRHAFCLCTLPIELQGPFRGLCLCPGKLRFPTAETGVGGDSVRMLSQCDWVEESAERARRRKRESGLWVWLDDYYESQS